MAEENASLLKTEADWGGKAEQEGGLVQFETVGDFFLGYRFVSSEDSLKAAEYIYPHSSVTLGMDLLSCPLPYRYHVNAELLSNYDFYTDAGFAYKDLVLFRDILVGVHHNLQHFSIAFGPDSELHPVTWDDRNKQDNYYVDFASNLLSLRLKAPDFPFHTFVNHRHVERDGRVQQRFFQYSVDDQHEKISEFRDLDWTSDAIKLGANSHLGPMEMEYAYDQAEFDPAGSKHLSDNFMYDTEPDLYVHHVVPETESSGHSVKLHSSYTGGIVTAATLASLYQKNNYSGTESTTWKGAFDFTWIPEPRIALFFKYRHMNEDLDTPDSITLTGLTNGVVNSFPIRQGISYGKDIFTLSSRYRPSSILSMFANYEFSYVERTDVTDWMVVPGHSGIHKVNLTARLQPLERLQIRARYEYNNYNQPAYNNTPDSSNKLRLTTTYTPSDSLSLYLEYLLTVTNRDSLRYLYLLDDQLIPVEGSYERDGRHHQLLASIVKALTPKVSLTASWFYQRWKIEQDLAFGRLDTNGLSTSPYEDPGVPYVDESNSFTLSLLCEPQEDLTVGADLTYTLAKGTSAYADVVGGAGYSLSSYSNVKSSETSVSFNISKKVFKVWEIGLRSFMNFYDDQESDVLDGKVSVTTVNVKRFF